MAIIGKITFQEEYLSINDCCLMVLTAGALEGKPIICLHGFPDTPHTFEHQFQVLLDAGYRIIVPFMRGYAPSQSGAGLDYFPLRLSEDVIALIDHYTQGSAVILGHDWGAIAAYGAAQIAPEKITKMIVAAVPPFKAFEQTRGDMKQLWRSRYAMLFQCGPLANWFMRRRNCAGLDWLWSYWSPTWRYTEADIQPLKDCLSQYGAMEAATGYYRAMLRGSIANSHYFTMLTSAVSVPTMVCRGLEDGCISPAFFEHLDGSFTASWQLLSIEGAGHFMHREKPDIFNHALLKYLSE